MAHSKGATEGSIIRMLVGKQQEMMLYHCQPGANMEREGVISTLSPTAF